MTDPAGLKESKLFNDEHFAPSKNCRAHEFHHFSRLPLELRLWIWTLSLMHHRFIPIYFVKIGVDGINIDHVPLYTSQNDLGNTISGSPYKLSVNARVADAASPLLSTTVESRLAAMEFFRIRVPLIQGHMRICPEYDVLYLQGWHRAPFILADVLHDIRAYDPEDEGLTHLALAHTDQPTFFDVAQPSDLLSGRARRNPNDVLADFDLDAFLYGYGAEDFHCNIIGTNGMVLASSDFDDDGGRAAGRDGQGVHHAVATASLVDILSTKLRSLCCIESLSRTVVDCLPLRPGQVAHPSNTCPTLPQMRKICRSSVNFDWFERDPTPMRSNTKQLVFNQDPRRLYHSWQNLEKNLGVRHTVPFHFFVCVASWMSPFPEPEGIRELAERQRQSKMLDLHMTSELQVHDPDSNIANPKHGFMGGHCSNHRHVDLSWGCYQAGQ
ncbi:hypothetical protein PG995_008029 [Apiospora arundinis]